MPKNSTKNKIFFIIHEKNNFPLIVSLILLLSAPVLILMEYGFLANEVAIYAYFFLGIGVLWKFIDNRKVT